MVGWRASRLLVAGLGALSLVLVLASDQSAVVIQAVSGAVMAAVLVRGIRRRDALRRSRILLLCSVSTALAGALVRVSWQLTTGALSTHLWGAEAVTLLWAPLAGAALLTVPAGSTRQGSRIRAATDGALAASSLWYLMNGLHVGVAVQSSDSGNRALLLVAPIDDLFLVATALTIFARCAQSDRRVVGWALSGLTTICLSDLLYAVPTNGGLPGPSSSAGLVNQVGMLLLIGCAAAGARPRVPGSERLPGRGAWIAGALPFVPLGGCVLVTSHLVHAGRGIPQEQVLPALAVCLALVARQVAGGRDKERVLHELEVSKRGLEAELRRDALTLLGNRTCLMEELTTALEDPSCWPVAVALLDLNDFKVINDNHGHDVGDAILVEVARRLRASVHEGDTVARLGGDEFAVVATRVEDGGDMLSHRLREAFAEPVELGNRTFVVRASIGLVLGQETEPPTTVLACADVAMYQAKERKSPLSTVQVLTPEGRSAARRALRVQEAIASPDLSQFSVVYQPVVSLETGDIRGLEALMRWHHPQLGTVAPDVFIPHAELAGTIVALGDHVMATALADLAALQLVAGSQRLAVGVNVSPRQLTRRSFVERTLGQLQILGLAPDQLVIEITEQAFETNLETVAEHLQLLADAGVSMAVDDFGTGYSSLRYLQMLPVEIMKIDKSFTAEIASVPRARQLVSSIVAMAAELDLQLVAEGIETPEQLAILQGMRCELGQGYLFSRPVPAAEIEALLRSGHPLPGRAPSVPSPRSVGVAVGS